MLTRASIPWNLVSFSSCTRSRASELTSKALPSSLRHHLRLSFMRFPPRTCPTIPLEGKFQSGAVDSAVLFQTRECSRHLDINLLFSERTSAHRLLLVRSSRKKYHQDTSSSEDIARRQTFSRNRQCKLEIPVIQSLDRVPSVQPVAPHALLPVPVLAFASRLGASGTARRSHRMCQGPRLTHPASMSCMTLLPSRELRRHQRVSFKCPST